jgi:hypothetical protein
MAANAVLLQNLRVGRCYLNRFVEVLKRESFGVAITIVGFADPFADPAFGDVAIIASRVIVMAGYLPAVVLVAHDVAIDARLRVIAHVGKPVSEVKCVRAKAP